MRSARLPLTALLLLLANHAHAASFDCAKATTPTERKICADPALGAADDDLATAWRDALAASLDRPALREEQRQWQRDPNATAADLLTEYRRRFAQLNSIAAAWRAVPRQIAAATLEHACFLTPDADPGLTCRVDETGRVNGDATRFYQLQSFFDGNLRTGGAAVVFSAAPSTPGQLTPVLTSFADTAHYDRPDVLDSPAGRLLRIPGHLEGTGNFNAEQLYLWRDNAWQDLDSTTWLRDLARRLPDHRYAAKGIYPDYRTMTATTPLWWPSDGNCCPTGGRAGIQLGFTDRRLVLRDLRVTPGANPPGR